MDFEELDYRDTPLGAISLRRRAEPRLEGRIIHEVKLGEEFLMSSLFPEAEIQLAKLGLAALGGKNLDVVVGGLGLGYTAAAALEFASVRSLRVIEVMDAVIDWHRQGLVPLGNTLCSDARCTLAQADFFALAASPGGFDEAHPEARAHALLLDIDHSPSRWLNPGNGTFYTAAGLECVAAKLHPGGLFGLWSDDPPEQDFVALLDSVFRDSAAHVVDFPNPYTGGTASNTVYLAHARP